MNATTTPTLPEVVSAAAATTTTRKAKAKGKPAPKPAGKGKPKKAVPEPPANNRGTPGNGPLAKPKKYTAGGLEVAVEPTANGNRYSVAGATLCGLLRWAGANGFTPKQAKAMLAGLKLANVVSGSTVGCQVGSARAEAAGKNPHHPGKVAEFSKVQAAALKRLLEA